MARMDIFAYSHRDQGGKNGTIEALYQRAESLVGVIAIVLVWWGGVGMRLLLWLRAVAVRVPVLLLLLLIGAVGRLDRTRVRAVADVARILRALLRLLRLDMTRAGNSSSRLLLRRHVDLAGRRVDVLLLLSHELLLLRELLLHMFHHGPGPVHHGRARLPARLREHGLGQVGAGLQRVPPEPLDVALLDGPAQLGGQAGVGREGRCTAVLDRSQALRQGPNVVVGEPSCQDLHKFVEC